MVPGLCPPWAITRAAASRGAARAWGRRARTLAAGRRVPLCITNKAGVRAVAPAWGTAPCPRLPDKLTLRERLPGLRLWPQVTFRGAGAGAGAGARARAGAGAGAGAGARAEARAGQAGEAQGPPRQDPLQRVLQAVERGGRGGCPWANDNIRPSVFQAEDRQEAGPCWSGQWPRQAPVDLNSSSKAVDGGVEQSQSLARALAPLESQLGAFRKSQVPGATSHQLQPGPGSYKPGSTSYLHRGPAVQSTGSVMSAGCPEASSSLVGIFATPYLFEQAKVSSTQQG